MTAVLDAWCSSRPCPLPRARTSGHGPCFALRDGPLITGQQRHSGAEVARLVIAALEGGGA